MLLKQIDGNFLSLDKSMRFVKHAQDPKSFAIIVLNQINNGIYYELTKSLTKDSVVLDLGGNVGMFGLYIAPNVKKVISVEPTPSHIEIFKDLIDSLNITNIEIVNAAISINNDKISFNIGQSNTTMNSIVKHPTEHANEAISVQGLTLDKILSSIKNIDFCKMDIEGYENILLNDDNFMTIASQKIKKLFVEIHEFDGNTYEHHLQQAENRLSKYNFHSSRISHDSLVAMNLDK